MKVSPLALGALTLSSALSAQHAAPASMPAATPAPDPSGLPALAATFSGTLFWSSKDLQEDLDLLVFDEGLYAFRVGTRLSDMGTPLILFDDDFVTDRIYVGNYTLAIPADVAPDNGSSSDRSVGGEVRLLVKMFNPAWIASGEFRRLADAPDTAVVERSFLRADWTCGAGLNFGYLEMELGFCGGADLLH